MSFGKLPVRLGLELVLGVVFTIGLAVWDVGRGRLGLYIQNVPSFLKIINLSILRGILVLKFVLLTSSQY